MCLVCVILLWCGSLGVLGLCLYISIWFLFVWCYYIVSVFVFVFCVVLCWVVDYWKMKDWKGWKSHSIKSFLMQLTESCNWQAPFLIHTGRQFTVIKKGGYKEKIGICISVVEANFIDCVSLTCSFYFNSFCLNTDTKRNYQLIFMTCNDFTPWNISNNMYLGCLKIITHDLNMS
jgi:hypothetical protein